MEKFSEDSNYAFDCILLEFYKLWPIQAEINGVQGGLDNIKDTA